MIHSIIKFLWSVFALALLISCGFLTIFGGVIVIAATEIDAMNRFMALMATIFFGMLTALLIDIRKEL